MESRISEIFEWYAGQRDRGTQEQIVQMLRELQEVSGFLTEEMREEAARTAGVKRSMIEAIVRRYPSLKTADYRHVVVVCCGERCAAKGGGAVLSAVRKKLGIEKEGISADGVTLLKIQNCLKQCRTSPNLKIDEEIYRNVTPARAEELIEQRCRKDRKSTPKDIG